MIRARHLWVLALAAAVAALWAFPLAFFQHPGVNDAIALSDWELPIILIVSAACVISAFAFRQRRPAAMPIGLGVYLIGVAAALRLGFAVFGNTSEDRFMPLLFAPVLVGCAGVATLAGGLGGGRARRRHLWRAVVSGLGGAAFIGAWVLVRGARDWLLAPYGFDIVVLIALGAGVVAVCAAGVERGTARRAT